MKFPKFLFILSLLSYSTLSFGQISDDEVGQLASVACECVNADDMAGKSMDNLQMVLGLCIMEGLGKYPAIFEKVNIEDEGSMEKLGERIGLSMLTSCPDVMMTIAMAELEGEEIVEADDTMSGTIQSIDGNQFTYITIKTESGRTEKYLWLTYFDGADALSIDGQKNINKKVTISYTPIECYSNSQKEYIFRKMITSLSFDN